VSAGNFFETRRRAYDLRTKAIVTTYTTRAGGASDDFIEDRVITVSDAAENFTITVSNGVYEGQRLLITVLSNTSSITVTVTTTTGDDCTLDTAGDYVSLEWVNATAGWQEIHSEKAS
jgi:hypothetical protein